MRHAQSSHALPSSLLLLILALLSLLLAPASLHAQLVEWAQRAVSGPSGRHAHAMAFDSARAVTVLFGGWAGTTIGISIVAAVVAIYLFVSPTKASQL